MNNIWMTFLKKKGSFLQSSNISIRLFNKSYSMYNKGFTVIELMVVLGIVAALSGLTIPGYLHYAYKVKVTRTITEINMLEKEIWIYQLDRDPNSSTLTNETLPASLSDIGRDSLVDPWGNPYQYTKLSGNQNEDNGIMRKDRFAQPVNTDYDLYSKGRDKLTQASLTAEESHDDVIRGNNGLYKGLASAF